MSNTIKQELADAYLAARAAEAAGRELSATALLKQLLILSLTDRQAAVYRIIRRAPTPLTAAQLHAHFATTPRERLDEALRWLLAVGLIEGTRLSPTLATNWRYVTLYTAVP